MVTKTWLDIAKKHGFIKDYDIIAQIGTPSAEKPPVAPPPVIAQEKAIEVFEPEKNTPESVEKKKKGRKPKQKQ